MNVIFQSQLHFSRSFDLDFSLNFLATLLPIETRLKYISLVSFTNLLRETGTLLKSFLQTAQMIEKLPMKSL